MGDDSNYPIVTCVKHPDARPAPGFAVCVHVLEGAPVAYFLDASPRATGAVLCEACTIAMRVGEITVGDGERAAR